ncbi:MAG: protein-export chaperone SecB [Micavibrio sp. TMED27]|nr:protein-export chaperone SecB [Micavibrio sp.]OUT92468.1 MAG: protein-export chaperone SecB [Micavibrio sp. TMED27]|tara:strand:- start:257 stop:757 length:501 start_codon:yes stop_codon:yes gene_type:complete
MSEENSPEQQQIAPDVPINILTQYVRDLSFENPNAPQSIIGGGGQPDMDLNIGMDARKIPEEDSDSLYEVVINLKATAKRGEDVVFMVELQYGATVEISQIPQENHHPVLLIEIPRLVFPYVRQIVSDTTVRGGFPPLLLNPVDFQALYMERFKDEIEAAQKTAVN